MRHPKLAKLEDELEKIQGITGVRIIGDEAPSEIHVVATTERPPKQIVRDVQSLTTTNLGEPIDHRIVSVVQVDNGQVSSSPTPGDGSRQRIALQQVVTASKLKDSWVRVCLESPDGEVLEAAVLVGPSREERARGAAAATIKALQPRLEALDVRLSLQSVVVQNDVQTPCVQCRSALHDSGQEITLVGTATIRDDVATAAAKAILQSLNRKLS